MKPYNNGSANSRRLLAAIAAAMIMAAAMAACRTESELITLTGITITPPAKTSYDHVGEAFDSTGLTVTAHFSDGSSGTPTTDISLRWNGQTVADGNTAVTAQAGYKNVTVSWRDKTAGFTLEVAVIHISTTAQWDDAITTINGGGNGKSYALSIDDDITVTPSGSPTFGTVNNLTVILVGTGTVSPDTTNGSIVRLQGSSPAETQTLIMEGPVTLKGKSDNNASVVSVGSDAALDMRNGKITGNNGNNLSGVGVRVEAGGSFDMSGGEISGNTSGSGNGNGGGVYVSGAGSSFTMTGGLISGNRPGPYGSGGGVYVGAGSSFTMTGGVISNNTAGSFPGGRGGGVYVGGAGSSFDMSGGNIINNGSFGNGGGGVAVGGGVFTMTGGEISGNTGGNTTGGGVLVYQGSFDMTGGVISGNDAAYGGGVFVSDGSTFSKWGGGIIYGDNDNNKNNGNPADNTATFLSGDTNGHAVYYTKDSSAYYCNDMLDTGDDIRTTDTLPTGSGQSEGNWTKE
jgi:hypothetical protein